MWCNVPGLGHGGGGGGETEAEDENSITGVTGQKRGRAEASAGVQSAAACCWISGFTGPIPGSVAGQAGAE